MYCGIFSIFSRRSFRKYYTCFNKKKYISFDDLDILGQTRIGLQKCLEEIESMDTLRDFSQCVLNTRKVVELNESLVQDIKDCVLSPVSKNCFSTTMVKYFDLKNSIEQLQKM
jgi:hypothetical protein